MFNRRSNRFPIPGNAYPINFDEVIETAENHLVDENPEAVLDTLAQLSPRQQKKPVVFYLKGMASLMQGNVGAGIADLQIAAQRMKKFPPVFINLAIACMEIGWPRMGWYYAAQYLKNKPNDPEGEQTAHKVIDIAKAALGEEAKSLGISFDQMKKVSFPHERAQIALQQGQFKQVLNETNKAIRMLPGWPAPRNNRTLAYFWLGRLQEAEREARYVLENLDADNIHALGNLIKIFASTLQWEKARPYAEKLIDVVQKSDLDNLDIAKTLESLAEWEDGEALFEIGKRVLEQVDEKWLSGISWYQIGAAAANTGHWKEARKAFEYSKRQGGAVEAWIEAGLRAAKRNAKQKRKSKQAIGGPGPGRQFPYLDFFHYLSQNMLQELMDMANRMDIDAALEKFCRRYPFAAGAYRALLWNRNTEGILQEARTTALDTLNACGTPGAYAELRKFAQGRYGTDEERFHAAHLLVLAGLHDPEEPFRLWSESQQDWIEVFVIQQEIRDPDKPPCGPKVMDLIGESINATHAEDFEKAVRILEKAVKMEPDCATALHNLGVQYMNLGKREKGEALIRRSVEVDPDYLFGYTTLAELALQRKDTEACKDYLSPIFRANVVYPEVFQRALDIQIRAGLLEGEYNSSAQALTTLKSMFPDYPGIDALESMAERAEIAQHIRERWLDDVHRYRLRELKKTISADTPLSDCLNRITSDRLMGSLRAWNQPTSGRKAERIARLVASLTNPEMLTDYLHHSLTEEHRAALAWLLEADGIRPWKEFTAKFGDDFDESPYWQWAEPETTPGFLRMSGLVFAGTLDGEQVALIPAELRPLLRDALAAEA